MPYGMPKDIGGDADPEIEKKMEDCVTKLKAKGHNEQSAIRICKVSIENKARKNMR